MLFRKPIIKANDAVKEKTFLIKTLSDFLSFLLSLFLICLQTSPKPASPTAPAVPTTAAPILASLSIFSGSIICASTVSLSYPVPPSTTPSCNSTDPIVAKKHLMSIIKPISLT